MEQLWNDTDRGTPKDLEKNLLQCHSIYHKSHHGLPWARSRASAARNRRLAAWTVARPTYDIRLCERDGPQMKSSLRFMFIVESRTGSSLLRYGKKWFLLDGTWPEAGGRGRGHTWRPSTSQKSGRARQGVTESAHSTLPKTVELRECCRSAGGERERERASEKWTGLETNLGMAVPPSWMQSSELASGFISILMVLV
jgi:hypothetical protein